jgi:hypothetical protein
MPDHCLPITSRRVPWFSFSIEPLPYRLRLHRAAHIDPYLLNAHVSTSRLPIRRFLVRRLSELMWAPLCITAEVHDKTVFGDS